jgi:hypothetical protein
MGSLPLPARDCGWSAVGGCPRRIVRQQRTKPLVEELKTWLENTLTTVSRKSTIAEVIRYGLSRWDGLVPLSR